MRRRSLGSAIFTLVAMFGLMLPSMAQLEWCQTDPIVELNGTRVQILVSVPVQYQPRVQGPTDVRIATPASVKRDLLMTDAGFNGHGERVRFETLGNGSAVRGDGSFPTQIQVKLPVDTRGLSSHIRVPVRVQVIPEHGAPMVIYGDHHRTQVQFVLADG